jgi:hypothetical protein
MKIFLHLVIIICYSFCVSASAAEITDSAETLGYEVLSGYGLGTVVGLSGYLIHKGGNTSWMPRSFAYTFPAGAAAGVLLAGEIKGETSANRISTIAVTLVSAYIPLLVGELIGPEDGRALGALFSVPAATAAYNYIKEGPDNGTERETFLLSFSVDI